MFTFRNLVPLTLDFSLSILKVSFFLRRELSVVVPVTVLGPVTCPVWGSAGGGFGRPRYLGLRSDSRLCLNRGY